MLNDITIYNVTLWHTKDYSTGIVIDWAAWKGFGQLCLKFDFSSMEWSADTESLNEFMVEAIIAKAAPQIAELFIKLSEGKKLKSDKTITDRYKCLVIEG